MAVANQRPLTQVRNTIGGPLPDNIPVEERRYPASKRQTLPAARPIPPTMRVMSPEGVIETHLRFNARDLINIKGWTEVRDEPSVEDDGSENDETTPIEERDTFTQAVTGVRADRDANPALVELDDLRHELRKRGVAVDNRVGIRRLKAQLAALESHDA